MMKKKARKKKSKRNVTDKCYSSPEHQKIDAVVGEKLEREMVAVGATDFGRGVHGYSIRTECGTVQLKKRRDGSIYITFDPPTWLVELVESLNSEEETPTPPKKKKKRSSAFGANLNTAPSARPRKKKATKKRASPAKKEQWFPPDDPRSQWTIVGGEGE